MKNEKRKDAIIAFFAGYFAVWMLIAISIFLAVFFYGLFTWKYLIEQQFFVDQFFQLKTFKIINGVGVIFGLISFFTTITDDYYEK